MIVSIRGYATHILGGELLYENISGNTYRVTLTIYGDCSGTSFPQINNSRPIVTLFDGTTSLNTMQLIQQGPGVEVSAVCPAEINNTKCKSMSNAWPGVTRYIFAGNVNINVTSADLKFVFNGILNGTSPNAGRSNAITNIYLGGGSTVIYLEAGLNNTNGANSSPKYNSIPTPYFCVGKPQLYNQAAADQNNDSLYFSLTSALDQNGNPVPYLNGASPAEPLTVNPGSFTYNSINGQLSFIPSATQTSVVVNRVDEYKNGVLVGYSMREMNMIVLGTCNNSPPNTTINNDVVGGKYAGNNVIYTCNDSKEVTFSISAIDSNKDHVNVVATNVPTGAILNILHNNTDTPDLSFRWPLAGVPNGTYSFYVEFTDDACPISSKQTVAYTIVVVSPFTFDYTVAFPTRCFNKAYLNMLVANGASPKDITITLNGNYKVKEFRDSTDGKTVFADSFVVGNYRIDISSPNLPCSSSYTFTVVDSGKYPFPPEYDNIHLCTNDNTIEIPTTSKIYHTPIYWYTLDGTKLSSAPAYDTKTPKTYYYLVTQQVGACESVPDSFKIIVHNTPDVEIINSKPVICLGDNLLMQAKGADTYEWLPADKVTRADDGNFYTKIMQPSTYQVLGRTLYGCVDSASVTYNKIEQCCSYYYPSAFTPNNDGRNDGFRISVFGNTSQYQLSVYNRWGELVFMSNDPKKYWDGTYKGKTCDVGTYYYRVTGVCLTGPQEEQAGEFLLIR